MAAASTAPHGRIPAHRTAWRITTSHPDARALFISEAARIRGISTLRGQTDPNYRSSDPHPLIGWGVDWSGQIRSWVLWTAALYADYVLNTAKGR